jgi:WD40 repeat protein
MKSKNRIKYLGILMITLLCVGISLLTPVGSFVLRVPSWLWLKSHTPGLPTIAPPPTFVTPCILSNKIITLDNLAQTTELMRLSTDTDEREPVAALAMSADGNSVIAAYSYTNVIRRWLLSGETLSKTLSIGPVSITATDFDSEGELLVTAAGKTPHAEAAGYTSDVYGAYLWNTETGELLDELYTDTASTHKFSGVALSSDGQWLAAVSSQSLVIYNTVSRQVVTNIALGGTELILRDKRVGSNPDVVTFDHVNQIVVWADREGRIEYLKHKSGAFSSMLGGSIDKVMYQEHTNPLAISFDSSRRWLATVRGNQLELWSVGGKYIRRVLSSVVDTGVTSDLAFSPSGDLLAVATNNGWEIWDVNGKLKIASGGDLPCYALTFSPSGQFFVWGDRDGAIHVVGIP